MHVPPGLGSGPAFQHLIRRTVAIGPHADIGDDLLARGMARLDGGRRHVRKQHDIVERQQTRINGGFVLEYVQARAGDAPFFQRVDKCGFVDELPPRIRSLEGEFVVHAAVVRIGEGVVLITGPSGRGKSTLAASLDASGATLIGDDAAVVDVRDGRALASASYPSLRLLPDSLAALYGTARESSPTAHYTTKRRLVPMRASHEDLQPLPCLALFLLAEPTPAGEPTRIERIEPRRTCIELLRESFALDPSDTAQAAERLRQASTAAELIPAFELAYPRDYAVLPEVGRALIAAAKGLS